MSRTIAAATWALLVYDAVMVQLAGWTISPYALAALAASGVVAALLAIAEEIRKAV